MDKLYILLVLAIIVNEAVGMTFRHRRQAPEDDENSLDERYGWDRPQGQWDQGRQVDWPNQWPGSVPRPRPRPPIPWPTPEPEPRPSPTTRPNGSTTQSSEVAACIRNCPVTPEYNPVCGTNTQTYNNPGLLICAQSCGVDVKLLRSSRCPTTTTAAPAN